MNKSDLAHLDAVQQLGCVACYTEGVYSPAEIHHVVDGNKRLGHQYVLPLCVPHHRGGGDGISVPYVSRHPYKKRFELRYGTEEDLLLIVETRLHG